ncbi:MAG: aminotransferase class I/II-fold pyridoxal phosphate-dependent enzyme [Ignavibacteriae bacterium]|nr:aminotransferase class I/II-fold pyridoxal phosphate-dependent enzyme [Ignavibacteria bacterium]MBI3364238.1 aminotransferase class I/II-fold pyridoxal phosphate-dependent enzyme [Ignavibacteriota bacterium]
MTKQNLKHLSLATRAIHGKHHPGVRGPVTTPIYQTSTYRLQDSSDAIRYSKGDPNVLVYTRYHNPTVNEAEDRIALIEDGEAAALFSSGMAAISTAILSLCKSGDEIVSTPALYGGTYRFFRDTLPDYGINVKYVDPHSLEDLLYLITPKTKVVYFETPTNPTLTLVDIEKLVRNTRRVQKEFRAPITVIIDNTFATILNQKPFNLGVDIIMESTTKYLGGHADIMGGVIIGTKRNVKRVKNLAKHLGGCMDPFAAFLLDRSLKTFELRVERQNDNAMALARALSKHPKISCVLYPGLPSHPQHKLAKRQMRKFGAMVTIEVKGGVKAAVRVCDHLRVAVNAMSLGGVETLVSIPVYSSHINMTKDELATHGVTPGMIRISVGVEGIDDLIEDFRQALRKL